MTGKLYEALDLDSFATPDDVKKAYRRAARKAHPDAGGSAEQFALITLARDCLSDAERRRKYDATGDAGETTVDDTLAKAMQIAMAKINEVLQKGMKSGRSPFTIDIVIEAQLAVSADITGAETMVAQQKANVKQFLALMKRFKARRGKVNRIGPMFEAHARQEQAAVDANLHHIELLKKAFDLLKDHIFDKDAPEQPFMSGGIRPPSSPFWQTF